VTADQAPTPLPTEVCLINLDRSRERLASFVEFNAHLGEIARFSAVDGAALDIEGLVKAGLVTANIHETFTPGAVGCALSHIALWRRAIVTNQTVTVAEDDAIFHGHFRRHTGTVIKELPPDWDIILWGWNFDLFLSVEMLPGVSPCLAQFEKITSDAALRDFQRQELRPHPLRVRFAFGTPCYSVTPNGARRLLSKCLPLQPFVIHFPEGVRATPNMPFFKTVGIDVTLSAFYRELNAFVCFPPVVATKNDITRSTIAPTR
jgi:GR25 family glycosyltransferase involved in LPS biosynthesis